jgi:hypothetical protein
VTQRKTLPHRRAAETVSILKSGSVVAVTLGYFPDGTPAEVFVSGAKVGSEAESIARDGAVLLSLALQHGVPLETIKHAITRDHDGTASTIIGAVVDNLLERAR